MTTLRQHMQSSHKAVYQKWAETNRFLSMLPKDAENRRKDAETNNQSCLDPHPQEKPQNTIPYTDELFRNAAIEWLMSTNQPIQAFKHPSFQNMIHVASHVTNGVKIPNRCQTRQAIIDTFKWQLTALHDRLNV
ncbi:hypothetical protein F5148DRAFT_985456 [Russula earlei]|uniref:Uncharacterized protein n=1 Tax=Russula earlei TaxID=71964 RepID=A0ACC0U071_9AGAM|nr:hypothetical protein F5148DRAFT_985456 [Russula earlei]